MKMTIYEIGEIEDEDIIIGMIVSTYQNKNVYVRHKDRKTYEIPGGHRENNETIEECAKRELMEETGATKFTIEPLFILGIEKEGIEDYGQVFLADIKEFSNQLEHEMEEVIFLEGEPESYTYPSIQEIISEEIRKRAKKHENMIQEFQLNHLADLIKLAQNVYLNSSYEELETEFKELYNNSQSMIYLSLDNQEVVGFAQFEIRNDYVEGVKNSPCGYLEGVFVECPYRRKGIAKALVLKGEEWAKSKNCEEFASDCELENIESYLFHQQIGFREVSRNIHFVKRID
ncbi:aminoglycoside 6'-N-acetyltransferase [Vagococcus fluvialis]|uniref:aminoglycoside 6'-N-acetyltransferase n=3 Tax=Bacteria TaxID=2 RepID=UPI00379334D3